MLEGNITLDTTAAFSLDDKDEEEEPKTRLDIRDSIVVARETRTSNPQDFKTDGKPAAGEKIGFNLKGMCENHQCPLYN